MKQIELFHLTHDDLCIGCSLAYMITRAFVPAFHDIGKYHDKCALHLCYGLGLLLEILGVYDIVLGHLAKGAVEVFYLVARGDIKPSDALQTVLYLFFTAMGKSTRTKRHGIDRHRDVILRDPHGYRKYHDENTDKQR